LTFLWKATAIAAVREGANFFVEVFTSETSFVERIIW